MSHDAHWSPPAWAALARLDSWFVGVGAPFRADTDLTGRSGRSNADNRRLERRERRALHTIDASCDLAQRRGDPTSPRRWHDTGYPGSRYRCPSLGTRLARRFPVHLVPGALRRSVVPLGNESLGERFRCDAPVDPDDVDHRVRETEGFGPRRCVHRNCLILPPASSSAWPRQAFCSSQHSRGSGSSRIASTRSS